VGRLAKDTGIMVYLEAIKILKNEGKNYSLVVCGEGPQLEETKDYAKKNKLNVNFVGFVEDVNKFMNSSKFVFVSRYLGILEALMAKKLIFSVYDSPIKEDYLKLAPFSQYILIEKEAVALAKKISYFANRPGKAKEFIEKGFFWVKEQTWEKLTKDYLFLWEKRKSPL
jgi:glycosyltransferase involved in cell wall biosynthesis